MADYRRICSLIPPLVVCLTALILLTAQLVLAGKPPPADTKDEVKKYFAGTKQEVVVHYLTGREKGPTLLIFGGIHGDEAGGYLAADRYANLQITRGRLIVVPRLNLPAVTAKKRNGLSGDMNRLFHLPEGASGNPDLKVVNLAKSLIRESDYVLNLHQAYDFYFPKWVNHQRNPRKWGQSNVIDTPSFDLPTGKRLELGTFAHRIAKRCNAKIKDQKYFFHVNNTDTAGKKTRHIEQQRSLTYYALYKQHKMAVALEATKNCNIAEAVTYLTIAVNTIIEDVGIKVEQLPSEKRHAALAQPSAR